MYSVCYRSVCCVGKRFVPLSITVGVSVDSCSMRVVSVMWQDQRAVVAMANFAHANTK